MLLRYLSENVDVKILLLTLIEKFSRTCDFCLIIADRRVVLDHSIQDGDLHVARFIHMLPYESKQSNCWHYPITSLTMTSQLEHFFSRDILPS